MHELTEVARELVNDPPRPPSHLVELRNRIDRRRRHRNALAVGTIALVLLVGSVSYVGYRASHVQWVDTTYVTKGFHNGPLLAVPPARPLVRPGEKRVNFGAASIVVPKAWTVVPPNGATCDEPAVWLGQPGAHRCKPPDTSRGFPSSIQLQALSSSESATGVTERFNDHRAIEVGEGSPGTTIWQVPDLGLTIRLNGPDAKGIMRTLSWSDRQVALVEAKAHAGTTPPGWKPVSYEGVQFSVPPTFTFQSGERDRTDPGDLCVQNPVVFRNVVYRGESARRQICLARLPAATVPTGIDGVWVRTGADTTGIRYGLTATHLPGIAAGNAVSVVPSTEARNPFEPTLVLVMTTSKAKSVWLTIGLGPDPTVAGRIIASLHVE